MSCARWFQKNAGVSVFSWVLLATAVGLGGVVGVVRVVHAQGAEHHDDHGAEAHDDHGSEQHDDHGAEHHDDQGAEHHDDHGAEQHDDHEESSFSITDFERHGVSLASAVAGRVDATVELPGEVRPNADRVAHLAPRFPGLVREVRRGIGDTVEKGEVLARIESDNLSTYSLVSGFDGVVIDRHIAPGESVTRGVTAFVVADLSTVWVHVKVYQKALPRIAVGQSVMVSTTDGTTEATGTISYLAPVVDQATRTATARVVLDNGAGRWRPGSFVVANVSLPVDAGVVVTRRALHSLEGRTVVFVEEDDTFVARPVTLGAVGRRMAAITAGLNPGERYADQGSFLVKAELSKSDAGHAH